MDNKAGKIGRSFTFHEEFDDGRRLMRTWAEGVCEVDVGDEEMVPNAYTMSSGAGAPDNSSRDEPPQRFPHRHAQTHAFHEHDPQTHLSFEEGVMEGGRKV